MGGWLYQPRIPPRVERLDNVPEYKIAEMNYLLENRLAVGVRSSDPGALNGVDAG